MTKYRLKENHPLQVKFDRLCEVMDEMGVRLLLDGAHLMFEDNQTGQSAMVQDLENQDDQIGEFPPALEIRLIQDK